MRTVTTLDALIAGAESERVHPTWNLGDNPWGGAPWVEINGTQYIVGRGCKVARLVALRAAVEGGRTVEVPLETSIRLAIAGEESAPVDGLYVYRNPSKPGSSAPAWPCQSDLAPG